jgi:predicted thioesterase
MTELKIGMTHTIEAVVDDSNSTSHMGGIKVLSTPKLVQYFEETCHSCVAPQLAAGQQTVGTMIMVKHLAATPQGMKFRTAVELVEVERRRLKFKLAAYDEAEKIGEGEHERFIIDAERFVAGLQKKLKP